MGKRDWWNPFVLLPRDNNRSIEYFKKHRPELIKPVANDEVHIEVTHGDSFFIWGPRVAAISADDFGMSRIERDLESASACSSVEELRSFARKPDSTQIGPSNMTLIIYLHQFSEAN